MKALMHKMHAADLLLHVEGFKSIEKGYETFMGLF
jgi:hypothetical protein